MFGFVRNLFAAPRRLAEMTAKFESLNTRFSQMDGARTDRTNIYRWKNAKDESINAILRANIETLRARSQWESINNGVIKGVVATLANDIVGGYGPKLQVVSDDQDFNAALEDLWANWFEKPDANGVQSGCEMLRAGIIDLCKSGDMFFVKVNTARSLGVSLRLQSIAPRRVASPYTYSGNGDVFMGIRFDEAGKPLEYFIEKFRNPEAFTTGTEFKRVPAENVIHYFERLDPEQARGFPWLTPALPVISDCTDYETSVLKTAHTASMLGVMLINKSANVENPYDPGASVELESGMISTAPPGYEPFTVNPNQPTPQYESFINSQRAKMGRPFNMPLIKVNLDARGHSWSSARSDTMSYHDHISCIESDIERVVLNPLVEELAREARLIPAIRLAERPPSVRYEWTWPVPSQVEPMKEAQAATERISNRTSNLKIECARMGYDYKAVIEQRAKEIELLKDAGIEPEPMRPNQPQPTNAEDEDEAK